LNKIIQGDSLTMLKTLPDASVDCCITSPPYWGLRDYQVKGQLGLEDTPEEYVAKILDIFREVRRVLKKEATLWLNLGDSYWGSHSMGNCAPEAMGIQKHLSDVYGKAKKRIWDKRTDLKPKDLIGIPWRVAFALQADGWWLRQDIIWAKPNPMPESVTDRCTKSHEYVFLMTKSAKYYFDNEAIKETAACAGMDRGISKNIDASGQSPFGGKIKYEKRNKRSVWFVNTRSYPESHFATFPGDLIIPMIKAGCPTGGVVLDPFSGAGTTCMVAKKLERNYIGIELNEKYIELAEKRIEEECGTLF